MADELAGLPQNIAPWFPPRAAVPLTDMEKMERSPYEMLQGYLETLAAAHAHAGAAMAARRLAAPYVSGMHPFQWDPVGVPPGLDPAFANIPTSSLEGVAPSQNIEYRGNRAPALPAFAEGGIVDRPTVAMVGESGPEAIIPLSSGAPGPFDALRRLVTQQPVMDIYRQGVGLPPQGKVPSPDFIAPPPMGRVLGTPPGMAIGQPPGVLTQEQAQTFAGGALEPFGQAGRLMEGASQDVPGDLASVLAASVPIGPPGAGRALKAGLKVIDDGVRINIAPRAMEIPEWGKGLTWGLTAYRSKVGGEDVMHVRDARLPPEIQGQGHGTAMYEHAADLAAKENRTLVSDGAVTQDAANRWMALNRKGYNVQISPDKVFRPGPPDAPHLGRFETPDGSPVFRVDTQ